jgi:hypothetical protein
MCYSPSIPNFDVHYIDQVSICVIYLFIVTDFKFTVLIEMNV